MLGTVTGTDTATGSNTDDMPMLSMADVNTEARLHRDAIHILGTDTGTGSDTPHGNG